MVGQNHGRFSKSCEPGVKALLSVLKHLYCTAMEKHSVWTLEYTYQTLLDFIHHCSTFYLYLKTVLKETVQPPMAVSLLLNCPVVPCHENNPKSGEKGIIRKASLAPTLP